MSVVSLINKEPQNNLNNFSIPQETEIAKLPNPEAIPKSQFDLKASAFQKIDGAEAWLNKKIPKIGIQKIYDKICNWIEEETHGVKEFKEFNRWVENNGQGPWYERLVVFLAKLPIKVARNICTMVVNVIKLAIATPTYFLMHPMKFFLKLTKILIELLQPETWTKIGGALMGSSAATAAVTGGFSAITFAIGAALAFAGITIGTLKTALVAEKGLKKQAVKNYLIEQAMQLSESVATSFCLVMTLEAIQQVIRGIQKLDNYCKNSSRISSSKYAHIQKQSNEFINTHPDLPSNPGVYHTDDYFTLTWNAKKFPHGPTKIDGATFSRTEDIWVRTDSHSSWVTHWTSDGPYTEYVTVNTPIYEPHYIYRVNLQGWVAPEKIPLGAAPRISSGVMANSGALETIKAAESEEASAKAMSTVWNIGSGLHTGTAVLLAGLSGQPLSPRYS